MAGDWIKMRGNLWDDPRVARLVDMTDSSEAAIVGSLYWLWATADQHTEDGVMMGLTCKGIDRKTGIQGFAAALCSIDWLQDRPDGVLIVDFEKHNGASAKKRSQTAKRVASHTAANASSPAKGKEPNAPLTPANAETNADSVSSALAREEKRREEKEKEEKGALPVQPPSATDDDLDVPVGPARPSIAGAICVAMKAEGMAAVNPNHPELQVLIDKGADIGLFAAVARECTEKRKNFAYALAMVKGRMADAAVLAGTALALPTAKPLQAESFAAQDQRMKRKAWEDMTGEAWPADNTTSRATALVIDITETTKRIA